MKRLLLLLIFLLTFIVSYAPSMGYTGFDYRVKACVHLNQALRASQASEFDRFLKDLGQSESTNNWKAYNSKGYIGEWQFGKAALKETGFGHVTSRQFRVDPKVFSKADQLKAITILTNINARLLKEYIDKYEGRTIGGLFITKSGLLAACHLGGARSVKLFLKSNGRINRRDSYGTGVGDYLLLFKNYNF